MPQAYRAVLPKAVELSEEELAQVSGGNKQMSDIEATWFHCSCFGATQSTRLAGDEVRCKSCVYLLLKDNNYYRRQKQSAYISKFYKH